MSDVVGQEGNMAHDLESVPDGTQPYASISGQSMGSEELEFHSPADSEDDTDSNSSSDNGGATVGVAPPLGQHEKYHVFFCYSKTDAPWVKNMVQKLESDELGFKCCFHERDFIPGMAIIENIVRSIQKSQKTVFVLSREFVASRWCNFERQMVMGANLREENKKVIPVMLRECDLPDFLHHMTYLEEWTPYFFERFIGAMKEPASNEAGSQSDSFSTFTYNPNYNNGQQLLKIEATAACCPPCAHFDDQIIPSELTSKGIRIPREDYHEAISKLMETGKMKGFSCCSSEACFWIPTCLILAFSLAVIISNIYSPSFSTGHDDALYKSSQVFGLTGAFVLLVLLIRCISRIRLNREMKRTLLEVNSILVKSHILATVTDRCNCYPVAVLHFVYYERGSCLMKILEDLMARSTSCSPTVTSPSSSNMSDPPVSEGASSCAVPIEVDDAAPLLSGGSGDADFHEDTSSQTSRMSELKAEAEALLLKYSDAYVRLLVTRKLPQPRQSRGHTQQGACLCQLVEMREFSWNLDREETSVV
ncbi:uncharacterized protein [Branchiostoma lanceolatum]|uniref:uncharacterized protein n=1 Tax=Branchiostoma lanceolatum TaxID=7740 RepID=UPI00345134E6